MVSLVKPIMNLPFGDGYGIGFATFGCFLCVCIWENGVGSMDQKKTSI